MDNAFEFRDKLIKIAAVVFTFCFVLSMALMVTYAENKVVIVTEDAPDEEEASGVFLASKWMIDVAKESTSDGKIHVMCSYDISDRDINVATRYSENKIIVTINSAKDNFYLYNPPYGDFTNVVSAYGEFSGDVVQVTFEIDHPIDCNVSFANREVVLELKDIVKEKPVVVIDPGHGGSSNGIKAGTVTEQELVLGIALEVKRLSALKPYDVVLTRGDNSTMSIEDRIDIVKLFNADYYIGIHLSSDVDNIKMFGMSAVYNDEFYRKGVQNVSFADCVLKNVAVSASNRANSLDTVGEDEGILRVLDMPATVLYAGYMTNPDELMLLEKSEYMTKIALGIIEALDENVSE